MKAHSGVVLTVLAHLALIRVGGTTIKIARRCTDDIRRAIEGDQLLVVGEPGAGKSGALVDLVEALGSQGCDFVFLAVDQLAARSLGELREELGLEHEVADVFANWPGMGSAFLVVDALDAARDEQAVGTLRDLMRVVAETGGRWRVVASIRKFDLRYSPGLRGMFAGAQPSEFSDPEFSGVRHVNVPRLSDEELVLVEAQSPTLAAVLVEAPPELRDLLRVPFNLRLVGDLVGSGVAAVKLRPVRTQLELLDRYWGERVIGREGGRGGDAREGVVRRACDAMVAGRTLRTERALVVGPAADAPLRELLSRQVLMEWQPSPGAVAERYVLAFGHHVLFDYAVARLLLRGEPDTSVRRLEADPELPLVIRPSLVLHFRHLWLQPDRAAFWELVLGLVRSDGVPEIGKLIGPSVAAEMARGLADLEPLCQMLEGEDPTLRIAAEAVLCHLIGSALAQ